MNKVVCATCGLVNLQTFPSFPFCEACGTRLPSPRRLGWKGKLQKNRPALPIMWAIVVGAGVAILALLTVDLTRETDELDRGRLAIEAQSASDPRDPRATIWTLVLHPLNAGDKDALRGVRLRLDLKEQQRWDVSLVSPRPSQIQVLGSGRHFSWLVLPRGTEIRMRLKAPAPSSARPLRLLWRADGFEPLPLVMRVEGTQWKKPRKSFTLRP